jgi:GNAT superfamily N-acetyltransferase
MSEPATALHIHLEHFRPEHAHELVRMWRESFEHGVGIKDPHPIEEQERYLAEVVAKTNAIRVAFLEGMMVGFVAASPDSIAQCYVRKGFHRRGIGSRLVEWAKQQSRGSLWLYTFERNAIARAFYERHGFRIVARGHEPSWDLDDLRYEWTGTKAGGHERTGCPAPTDAS